MPTSSPVRIARLRTRALAAPLLCLAGCGSLPPAPPSVATPAAFHQAAGPADGTAPVPAGDRWWQLFADPVLDRWEERALRDNPGLAQAGARVTRAAAALGLQQARTGPRLDLVAGASRQQGPLVNAAGADGNLFTAALRLSIDADAAQRPARQRDLAAHELAAEAARERHARLMLQAEVAQTTLALQGLAAEQQLLARRLRIDDTLVDLAARRVGAGFAADAVHQAALAERWADAAETDALARRQALLAHALTMLAGRYDAPDAAADLPAPDADGWVPVVPAGLPAAMLQRRADIAVAEAMLQAARVRLGLARDAWFPVLTLTAQAGLASSELSRWLQASALTTGLGLLLQLPGLDGGRTAAERAGAEAALAEAAAAHRAAVLQALREVDDQLATLRTLADEAAARGRIAATAQAEAERLDGQWRRGLRPQTEALAAQRSALQQRRLWLQAQTERRRATVALVRALGGGWDDGPPPDPAAASAPAAGLEPIAAAAPAIRGH